MICKLIIPAWVTQASQMSSLERQIMVIITKWQLTSLDKENTKGSEISGQQVILLMASMMTTIKTLTSMKLQTISSVVQMELQAATPLLSRDSETKPILVCNPTQATKKTPQTPAKKTIYQPVIDKTEKST